MAQYSLTSAELWPEIPLTFRSAVHLPIYKHTYRQYLASLFLIPSLQTIPTPSWSLPPSLVLINCMAAWFYIMYVCTSSAILFCFAPSPFPRPRPPWSPCGDCMSNRWRSVVGVIEKGVWFANIRSSCNRACRPISRRRDEKTLRRRGFRITRRWWSGENPQHRQYCVWILLVHRERGKKEDKSWCTIIGLCTTLHKFR